MAIKDTNLLSILLAYSASHRAHLFGYPEPVALISTWVTHALQAFQEVLSFSTITCSGISSSSDISDISSDSDWGTSTSSLGETNTPFRVADMRDTSRLGDKSPSILTHRSSASSSCDMNSTCGSDGTRSRSNLTNTKDVSSSTLATVLLLISHQIVCTTMSGASDPWHSYLDSARSLILTYSRLHPPDRKEPISYFLIRWFARLDLFGTLSRPEAGNLLPIDSYWPADNTKTKTQVDCMLRYSDHYIHSLASSFHIAKAIAPGAPSQINPSRSGSNQSVLSSWLSSQQGRPSRSFARLGFRMHVQQYDSCLKGKSNLSSLREMKSMSTAFHWAGRIYLRRLSTSGDSPNFLLEEDTAVREIIQTLDFIQSGGPAENQMLFPMFIAGCLAPDSSTFNIIWQRLRKMKSHSMLHVSTFPHQKKAQIESIFRYIKHRSY